MKRWELHEVIDPSFLSSFLLTSHLSPLTYYRTRTGTFVLRNNATKKGEGEEDFYGWRGENASGADFFRAR
jgi:hypothetical protein